MDRSPIPTGDQPSEGRPPGGAILITAEEVARMMHVSTRTPWRLLSAGRLPRPVRIGGNTRWRLAEIIRWIEDGCPAESAPGRRG